MSIKFVKNMQRDEEKIEVFDYVEETNQLECDHIIGYKKIGCEPGDEIRFSDFLNDFEIDVPIIVEVCPNCFWVNTYPVFSEKDISKHKNKKSILRVSTEVQEDKSDLKVKYNSFQPCEHVGCLSHLSHPCEECGRIGGNGIIYEDGAILLTLSK